MAENLNKKLRTRIAQKWDTVENWEASSLVLLKGELAIDDQNRIKIGDGLHTWNELSFVVDKESTAVIDFPATLPAPETEGLKVGQLAVVNDQLYCLVEKEENGVKTREWAELSNADEIAGLNASIVALKNDMDAKDAAHDAAIVALQSSVDSDVDDIKDAVAQNAQLIAENRADLDGVLDITKNEQGVVTGRTIKTSALPSELYVDGKINSAALPAFVDDVVEGLVCISESDNDATYNLTHNGDAVVGFFSAAGTESGNTRQLKFVSATTPASTNLSAVVYEENGITYNFPADPSVEGNTIAPSSSIIYVDVRTNKTYRWSGSQFVVVASDLAIGETASSAFAGSRGVALENEINDTVDPQTQEPVLGLKSRVANLETAVADEAVARAAADKAHDSAMVALTADLDSFKAAAEAKHEELENEIASSIVALKEESERADKGHDAAIVALQEQMDSISVTANSVNFNSVIANSEPSTEGAPLNDQVLVLDCGGAEV